MTKQRGPRRGLEAILTGRLLIIAAAVIVVNIGFVAFFDASDRDSLLIDLAQRELVRLEAELTAVEGDPHALVAAIDGIYDQFPRAYAFAVVNDSGDILASKNVDLIPPELIPSSMFGQNWMIWQEGVDVLPVLALRRVEADNANVGVLFFIASDPANLFGTEVLDEFFGHVWLPLLPIAILLIGGAILVIQNALRPVGVAATWARAIQPGKRLPALKLSNAPAEIVDLTDAVRRSIERLDAELVAEQRRAAEAAHALRTPVAVLVARLDELPETAEFETVRADVLALSRTITQFLSSSGADRLEIREDQRADLGLIAQEVVAELYPYAEAEGSEITLVEVDGPQRACGSPDAISLALTNLIENAIHHAGPGLIEVSVGPGPCLTVQDHGPGLPDASDGSLFEPFRRGPGAPRIGAGLGLAIVARIQRAHGGTVDAETGPGGGTRITLRYRAFGPDGGAYSA